MALANTNYEGLQKNYLFSEVTKRMREYKSSNPNINVISLGVGDVTLPLPSSVINAMHNSVDEMSSIETFRGYGPETGYEFLINEIISNEYRARGINFEIDEVFISDGTNPDVANFQELFEKENIVAITDPVYPVYLDTNIMAGRAGVYNKDTGKWSKIVYLPCTSENNFIPELPKQKVDLIYLCFPNNPTGTALNEQELKKWVDYAIENNSIILYDGAYEAYITDENIPHSIYEIEGAKMVAVEFRSFSKTAGFTGVRCAYTVVPKEINLDTDSGRINLNAMWNRRQTTKFNGVSYITQKAAEAVYTPEGKKQIKNNIGYYMRNAKIITETLDSIGIEHYGGINSPYIWFKIPKDMDSWDFFDKLLKEANVVGTPGIGFGPSGKGYFRLTAFASYENTVEAMTRIRRLKF
ncbi:MAG: LL-diaminopimelate aminotransferase apoenzyme [Clostridia bacterium]|jgi:LL-diaminopimelate aminotransferase|nr:LL-diaminopimelate aminotransferase apoenzyme [Clostridia bacterium]